MPPETEGLTNTSHALLSGVGVPLLSPVTVTVEFFRQQPVAVCPSLRTTMCYWALNSSGQTPYSVPLTQTCPPVSIMCSPYLAKVNSSLISSCRNKTWVDFVDTTHDWTFWKRRLYLGAQGPLKLRIAGKNDSDGCPAFPKLWEFYWKHMHFFSKKEEENKVYTYYAYTVISCQIN